MDNLWFFGDLLLCIRNVYLFLCAPDGSLIRSNCPYETDVRKLATEDFTKLVLDHVTEHNKPLICTGVYHTGWIVDSKKNEGEAEYILIIGPFYADSFPRKTIRNELDADGYSLERRDTTLGYLEKIPVIGFTKITEITVMAHYALTGDHVELMDLHYSSPHIPEQDDPEHADTKKHGTYEMEREMLRMVREGDLRINEYLSKMGSTGNVGRLANDDSDPLRQFKNMVLVSIVLISRAAIEGGVYPDTAMTLTDRYFQAVEAAKSIQEITDISYAVQSDFVERVHKIRTNKSYSRTIQDVISYIELFPEEDIRIRDIATQFGYTEYYLTKKFKTETSMTFKEFLREKRLERAAYYLENHTIPIGEISERLKFSSQSYFTEKFREKYGMTPSEYQKKTK